jgi:hypothetical protein
MSEGRRQNAISEMLCHACYEQKTATILTQHGAAKRRSKRHLGETHLCDRDICDKICQTIALQYLGRDKFIVNINDGFADRNSKQNYVFKADDKPLQRLLVPQWNH